MGKKLKRVVLGLVLVLGLGAGVAKAEGVQVHMCNFYAVCEDNCEENGFYIMTTDQDGEAYFFKMKSKDTDYTGAKFLTITRGDKKNVVMSTELRFDSMLGAVLYSNSSEKAHYINNKQYR